MLDLNLCDGNTETVFSDMSKQLNSDYSEKGVSEHRNCTG